MKLLALLALVVAVVPAAAGAPRWATIRSPVAGYELRYPPGWHATRVPDGAVFVSSAPIVSTDPGARRAPGSALLWIYDYGQLHGRRPALTRPLRLPAPVTMEGFGTGSSLSFGLRGHLFQAFVGFGRGASARTRALATRTLGSLRTTAPALPNRTRSFVLGRSVEGRPIRAFELGDPHSPRKLLVVGCIHGDECAGTAATLALLNDPFGLRSDVWVIQDLNPDGRAAGTRQNAHGVDLNRNFGASWRRIGSPGSPQYSGPRRFSEPETRIARALIERIRPQVTIWFHQPQDVVRAWGGSIPTARRFAALSGLPFRALAWPAGTGPNWENHRAPGTASFVVELPPGPLTPAVAGRYARAIKRLATR